MQDLAESLNSVVPQKYQGLLALAVVIFPLLGRVYHALSTGGGLMGVVRGLVFGTNTPKSDAASAQDDPNQGKLPLPLLFWILTPLLALPAGCAFRLGRHGFAILPPVPPKNAYVRITARSIGITVAQNPATQSPELVLGFKSATYDRLPTSIGTNIFIPRVNADIEVNGGLDVSVTERLEAGK